MVIMDEEGFFAVKSATTLTRTWTSSCARRRARDANGTVSYIFATSLNGGRLLERGARHVFERDTKVGNCRRLYSWRAYRRMIPTLANVMNCWPARLQGAGDPHVGLILL
ncbi:hypothetical protein FB45DRAFT_826203 [Roridomyces roridus]|uniref:Uncharacterized protein n=1 Tax=Roridomyces roridus TaxID=1738132 RepID=A0AAD7FTK1_9AGAR|nr:hypothetical protein FB45DRAFT_826203 [Roridomyces roridus]